MKTSRTTAIGFLCVCISLLLGLGLGSYLGKKHADPETITEFVSDTVIVIKHDTIPLYDSILFSIPMDVDTAAIIQAFYQANIFYDTIINNDTTFIRVFDTVYQNRIIHREVEYLDKRPLLVEKSSGIYAGMSINTINGFGYGPSIGYHQNRWHFSLSADLQNNVVFGTVKYRLWTQRK